MLPDILFLMFAIGLLFGATLVIAARNPMIGVMGMIVTFLNASGLFILLGAEFLGLLMVMVYVGAIAVMFLFVLMTIDIDYVKLKEGFAPYLPLGLLVVGGLAAELIMAANMGLFTTTINLTTEAAPKENIVQLGEVLFTTYALPFQVAGLILLTAMIGAIVLTHRPRGDVKRQDITAQVMREKKDAMLLTKPETGKGAGVKYWTPKSVEKKAKR